jgi:toxin ParE1/3/4
MSGYLLTSLAQADVDQVWLHIARDRPGAADRMMARFAERFALLAANPEFGELRPDLGVGLRHSVVGNYVIVYRAAHERIEIVRVVHGARDLAAQFKPGGQADG